MLAYICQHTEMSAHYTSGEKHTGHHIEMQTHSTNGDKYADIYVNTFVHVLANMLTCPNADIYDDTS